MHITEVLRVAARAWEKVKPADDPSFNDCQLSFREQLISHTEGVIRTNAARTDFEKAVKEILDADGMKAPEEPKASPAPATMDAPPTVPDAAPAAASEKPAPAKAPAAKKSKKSTQ